MTFPIAANFSAAVVTVCPGGMREIHWHPTSDEWTFFISGQGRATLFTAPNAATTFDYRGGDVGYFPKSNSHYIENTGDEDLVFVEVLQAPLFTGRVFHSANLSHTLLTIRRYGSWSMDRVHSQANHCRHVKPE